MAGNSEIIDSVVDPIAIQQFNDLKAASAAATEQMVIATRAAVALNNATGGSQSFSVFKKNAEAANIAINTIIVNSEKVKAAEDKARAYKADMDEKAMNKYLTLLSKQEAARQAQDAKEVAAAEVKAAKLVAIQESKTARLARIEAEQAAISSRKSSINPVITDDSPTVRFREGVDAPDLGGRKSSVKYQFGSPLSGSVAPEIQAETIALTEQEAALRKNIQLHLELQAELAAIKGEMKLVNTETAVGANQMVGLKQRELETNAAISQNKAVLSQQTKEMISQQGSNASLNASLAKLRLAYDQLSVSEKENVAVGGKMLAEINILDAQTKKAAASQGVHNKEVGNYAIAGEKAEKSTANLGRSFTHAFGQLRQLAYILPGIGLAGIFNLAFEALAKLISELDLFNSVLSVSEMKQKALKDAFASTDYSKAIESTEKLAANLDLAKGGFADSNSVIDEYNNTIGKTFGYVDNLNDAQKGFIDNSDKYIKAIYLEAAANAVLADSSKFAAEMAVANQKIRNDIEDAQNNKFTLSGFLKGGFNAEHSQSENAAKRVADDKKELDENNKKIDESYKNSLQAIENFYKDRNAIIGKKGSAGGDVNGISDIAKLRNDVENAALEHRKLVAQNLINNDKLSYATRIQATKDYYAASKGIADNNEKLATDGIKLSGEQKKKIEEDYSNQLLQLQINRDNQLTTLREKQYKQDQEILKNNIQKQKDLFKSVIDDPNQSFSAKKVALEVFNARSLELIKVNLAEETKEAGKNAESKKIAQQNFDKATLQQANDTAAQKLKILKEELQKEITLSKQSQQDQLYDLQRGANIALQALTDVKDDKENALAVKRSKNLIKEKDFNKQILLLNDQFNIDRIAQELTVQQTTQAIQEGQRDSVLIRSKQDGASASDLAKIKADADKDIDATKNKIAGLKRDAKNADTKYKIDDSKGGKDDFKREFAQDSALAARAVDLAQQAEDAHYQHQIDLLEEKKALIDETAKAQIDGVNNSILSEADKARKVNIINAQAAQQKSKIDAQERKAKTDQARFDKEAGIAKIIISTAVAVVEALPNVVLAAVVGALGAAELAVAVSTPLPKFATGTHNSPEGFAHVGERGPELRIDPSGQMSLTPGTDTITYLEKGTQIIPNHMIRPEKLNYTGGQQVPWREVIAAIGRNKPEAQKRPVIRIQVNNDSLVKQMTR